MKTGPEWYLWCDDFKRRHGRQEFWEELVRAIQADALGLPEPAPLSEQEIAGLTDTYRLEEWGLNEQTNPIS